ncbi:MAG: C10 family peptidase, partial [Bacteroidales bacterium]|nr:C10 family peptidase [Bacteroidales bacterium]
MNFKVLLLSFLLILPLFTISQTVTEKKAKTIAKNFFYEKVNIKQTVRYEDIELVIKKTYIKNETVIFRVFEPLYQKGFILVSANESIIPVLGYSTENLYITNQELPPNFKEWINLYAEQIEYAEKQNLNSKNPLWNVYSKKPDLKNIKSSKDVSPLLSTTWNQGSGYNDLCPEDPPGSGNHVWAGCVATAMAQVMNYHEHPVSGEGSHSYNHYLYGELSADFESTVYDWANMPDNSGNLAVAELIYHCGVSVNMNYSPSGSGSYSSRVVTAWKNYFKYSSNLLLTSKGSYTDENWANMLIAEIDAGRPLYYHGYGSGGHAFNIDGYQGTDFFHLNWGWGGSYNGNYYLNDLTPGGMTFTNGQGTIVGALDRDNYPGIDCSSPIVLTAGVPYFGTTTTSQNIVNKYGSAYYHSTGKELVHQITTSFPGRLRATISDLNGNNLDVFILSHCNQDSLLAYGDTTAIADNTEPGTYYIVVDGRYGYEGDYTLTVTVPTNDPDLIISEQTIAPYYIEAGGIGNISFKISNIGNSSASSSKANIYYSEDAALDGSDIYIDQINIPALDVNAYHSVSQNIIIPGEATEGYRYIVFQADAENEVTESDEIYNVEFSGFSIPAAGIMDCSGSVSLSSGEWYFGNTETDGEANIDMYSCGMYSDKEVIHTITATHNGLATIEFSEKIPGRLVLMPLTACNENTCMMSYMIWMPEDTMIHEAMQVYAGITYYFIVDAEEGTSGNYSLKINMPEACPNPYISYWGEIDLCDSDGGVSLFTDWGYTDIQWYKDNVAIEGQTWANLWATESGDYKVEVIENGCSGFSETVEVRFSPEPSHAIISALGDTTFCEGNNVTLDLNTGAGYTVQWMKNGNLIEGETSMSFVVEETGIYTAEVTNISCSINSNTKQVTADPVTADIGELARVSSNDLVSWFSCDINDNTDLSGNGNDYFGAWSFPEDRHGNWAKATYYNGQWDNGTTTNTFDNPNTFTFSLWIQTNTSQGGMIFGLGDSQWGASVNSDRMIYMDDSGKLYFGVTDGIAKTVSTTECYNDNNWHLVTASLSGSGMKLYIDGELKAENPSVTSGADYVGWWKLAYDQIDATYPNVPTNLYYQGVIDDVRIYERELLAGEVSYLFEESQVFEASLEQNSFCEPGSTNVILSNTEAFIEYQLRDDADDSPVGSAVTGNAGTINLPTGIINETTTFNILATNLSSSCSFELNDLFTAFLNDLPTATLSGGETICEGETTDITINLTGTAPWNITYTDGTNTFNETTSDNPFVFAVSESGTYEITALSDVNCTGSDFSGEATVIVNDLPTAILSGGETICSGETTDITVNLTGTAPWDITYTDGTNTFNETTSDNPFVFAVSESGTYEITALSDVNCTGSDFSGEATVIVNDLPTAILSGGETICSGETTDITVNLTGTAPWDITYTDGTNTFNETTSDNPFVFAVSESGTYEITALSDV